jgi:uncharacterized protein (AIM24 family)
MINSKIIFSGLVFSEMPIHLMLQGGYVMCCPVCGHETHENERRCARCGAPISAARTTGVLSDMHQKSGAFGHAALEMAIRAAAILEAAAREAVAKERAARAEAVIAIKEASEKDAEARKAVEREKIAEAELHKATDGFDRAMKEAAHRTASKTAFLERAEANKAIAKATAAKQAADQAAAETARRISEAKKAAAEIARITAEESGAIPPAAYPGLPERERKTGGVEAGFTEAAAREAATERAAAQNAGGQTGARNHADDITAVRAAERAAADAEKKQAGAAAAQKSAALSSSMPAVKAEPIPRNHKTAGTVPAPSRLRYKINEGSFPSVSIALDEAQSVFTQFDAMVWMSSGMVMRAGEKSDGVPVTTYMSSDGWQEICIASAFPGEIWCLDMTVGSILVQKGSFLAAQDSVKLAGHVAVHMGGEQAPAGFVFQRLSGEGVAFIAIGGSLIERSLGPGARIRAHIANIAALEERVSFQTEIIPDMKKIMGGGEGRLLSTLTGPGRYGFRRCQAADSYGVFFETSVCSSAISRSTFSAQRR